MSHRLVEIGPGQGALTRSLLQRIGELDAIELDRDLLPILERECGPLGTFRLHNTDALKFGTLRTDDRPLRLVGNLPYNISTPLLFHLLEYAEHIADMHFMRRKEVVDRMAASPGSKAFGRVSVMLQVNCEVTSLFDIGPESFDPPPKVNSSVVRLRPLPEPMVAPGDMANFPAFIVKAFSQRRKTLRNNLKGLLSAEEISACGVDPSIRSESLVLDDLLNLHAAAHR